MRRDTRSDVRSTPRHHGARRGGERREPQSRVLRSLIGAGIGILSGGLFSLLLLAVAAAFLSGAEDPDALICPVSLSVLFLSSILVGIVAEKASNAPFLPTGLVAALSWVLLTLLASLTVGTGVGSLPTVFTWALRIPEALFVLFGSFLAKKRPRRIDRRRRRR